MTEWTIYWHRISTDAVESVTVSERDDIEDDEESPVDNVIESLTGDRDVDKAWMPAPETGEVIWSYQLV